MEFNLHLLAVSHHFSLHHGGDLLGAYLCIFAIVSKTFILALVFWGLYVYTI